MTWWDWDSESFYAYCQQPNEQTAYGPWKLVHSLGELKHSHQKDPLKLTQTQR